MSEERSSAWSVVRTFLTVTLATYLPFAWLLPFPEALREFGGLGIPGVVVGKMLIPSMLGLNERSFLCEPFIWTEVTVAFFTWLGRHGGGMRTVATICAFAWALLQSVALALAISNAHS